MDPSALVRTPLQTKTQAGNGNSRFGAEGLQVSRCAVGTPVVVPLFAVGLAHGRGVDVAIVGASVRLSLRYQQLIRYSCHPSSGSD